MYHRWNDTAMLVEQTHQQLVMRASVASFAIERISCVETIGCPADALHLATHSISRGANVAVVRPCPDTMLPFPWPCRRPRLRFVRRESSATCATPMLAPIVKDRSSFTAACIAQVISDASPPARQFSSSIPSCSPSLRANRRCGSAAQRCCCLSSDRLSVPAGVVDSLNWSRSRYITTCCRDCVVFAGRPSGGPLMQSIEQPGKRIVLAS